MKLRPEDNIEGKPLIRDHAAATSRPGPVVICNNSKGGVLKTGTAAMAIYLYRLWGRKPTAIDGEELQADILQSHQNEIVCHRISFEKEFGYTKAARVVVATPIESPIVISCPAGQLEPFIEYGAVLSAAAEAVARPQIQLWPMDPDFDSWKELDRGMAAVPNARTYAVRNLHHGKADEFESFNASELGQAMEEAGLVVNLKAIPNVAFRSLKSQERISFSRLAETGAAHDQMSLTIWRGFVEPIFKPILDV